MIDKQKGFLDLAYHDLECAAASIQAFIILAGGENQKGVFIKVARNCTMDALEVLDILRNQHEEGVTS